MGGYKNELPIPLYSTHSRMCKFESPEDDGYFAIAQQLVLMRDKAIEKRALRLTATEDLTRRFEGLTVPDETQTW
jgi:hypothetical protein